jgi:hypothetical protein
MNLPQVILGKSIVVNGVSTNGRIKIDNRSSKDYIAASNLYGGVDRAYGIRELSGYIWGYGDLPPVFPNQSFDLQFTLDGSKAVAVGTGGNDGVRCLGIEIFANPYEQNKENAVYYIVHFGGMGTDFSDASVPTDVTQPRIYSTKSLGVKFGYWNKTTHALVYTEPCYFAGMHLKIVAYADPDWSSCMNGIAYYPAGQLDWSLELTKRTSVWPIDTNPAVVPPMLTGQPASTPSVVNADGDYPFPDLDSVLAIQMATRTNADLSFNSYWQLLYGMLSAKSGDFNQKTTKPLTVDYTFEKSTSMYSRNADTGWSAGQIAYVTGSPGSTVTTQKWP